jgi:selenocysteine-specific elongation factor
MRVIGTAGHVDHGKSTLIQALTGTHPDRLKEEQAREMSIDLGFAWWTLPDGESVGVVDVPGHRDFIENMLAGVGGIDAVLFIVAADEGIMPQTREHLAILDLLQVQAGVIVLTKIDLVQDQDRLAVVEGELRELLAGTSLASAPIVRVSARQRIGLDELQQALVGVLHSQPHRQDVKRPRLPIDRVFTKDGFGTVVTGTLIDGSLHVGDQVEIQPANLQGRIRGIQNHAQKTEHAESGSRTAVNISGVDVDQLRRGDVLGLPGMLQPTARVDVQVRLLPQIGTALEHNTEVKLFIGAAERLARVRVLGVDTLQPGEIGLLQLEMREPLVALRADRYILRRPSPGETLGGGSVLDPQPTGRHKRFDQEVIARLNTFIAGDSSEVLRQMLAVQRLARARELFDQANVPEEHGLHLIVELIKTNKALRVDGEGLDVFVADPAYWARQQENLLNLVSEFHGRYPLRKGISREEARKRLQLDAKVFTLLVHSLALDERLAEAEVLLHLPGHQITLTSAERQARAALLKRFEDAPFAPPTIKECIEAVGEDLYHALVNTGELMPISEDVVFRATDYAQAVADVRTAIHAKGSIRLADMRDHWGSSRRYIQPLLEYMDQERITVRDGDVRRLKE